MYLAVDTIFSILWHRPNFNGLNIRPHAIPSAEWTDLQGRNQTSLVSKGVCQNGEPSAWISFRREAQCLIYINFLKCLCAQSASTVHSVGSLPPCSFLLSSQISVPSWLFQPTPYVTLGWGGADVAGHTHLGMWSLIRGHPGVNIFLSFTLCFFFFFLPLFCCCCCLFFFLAKG